MSRLPLVDPATAAAPVSDLFAEVQRRLGAIPNMTRAMANSSALLKGYLDLSGALSRGVFNAGTRELIALYLEIGRRLAGQDTSWGTKVVERLARELRAAFQRCTGSRARTSST